MASEAATDEQPQDLPHEEQESGGAGAAISAVLGGALFLLGIAVALLGLVSTPRAIGTFALGVVMMAIGGVLLATAVGLDRG